MKKRDEVARQWTLGATRSWDRKRGMLPPELSVRGEPCHQLDFRPLASRPMREERGMESSECYRAARGDEAQKVTSLSPRKFTGDF